MTSIGQSGGNSEDQGVFPTLDLGPPLPPLQLSPVPPNTEVKIADNVQALGVKRCAYGKSGRMVALRTNMYPCNVPDQKIIHYNVAILPESIPAQLKTQVIKALQEAETNVFTPKGGFDGRKSLFSPHEYSFGEAAEFQVHHDERTYKVHLDKVAVMDTEVIRRVMNGQMTQTSDVSKAVAALNAVLRASPISQYPFNNRCFYVDAGKWDMGCGFELRRGMFQSLQLGVEKTMVNVDISPGVFYKSGPLGPCAMELLQRDAPYETTLVKSFTARDRVTLLKLLKGCRVLFRHRRNARGIVADLSKRGADEETFSKDGETMTIADYMLRTYGITLQHPDVLCVKIGSATLVPIELCSIAPDQLFRRQIAPDLVNKVIDFATVSPEDRLRCIQNNLSTMGYQTSPYALGFGLDVHPNQIGVHGRVLTPQKMQFNGEKVITPSSGAWNMSDLKLYESRTIKGAAMIIYERENRFPKDQAQALASELFQECKKLGMECPAGVQHIYHESPQGNPIQHISRARQAHKESKGFYPNLIIVVLPDYCTDLYYGVKNAGDVKVGVATQCIRASKYFRLKESRYCSNIALKINAKLGGVNATTAPGEAGDAHAFLTDANEPTIVLGASITHPGPGSSRHSSAAAVTGSLNSPAHYTGVVRSQPKYTEAIQDLSPMVEEILLTYQRERAESQIHPVHPTRMIFFRGDVSEGQYEHVKRLEIPQIRAACEKLKINNIKLTFVAVTKRHRVRYCPDDKKDADKSGNAPVGTVIDREIVHPIEFDFYLQSHAGVKGAGTLRSAHYTVLEDENGFSIRPDALQQLAFALCHVHAPSTRSVSIPAPVYYADRLCARAKAHEAHSVDSADTSSSVSEAEGDSDGPDRTLEPVHANLRTSMFFQ